MIPTLSDYLMIEATMELVLLVAKEWAELPQNDVDPEEWKERWTLENRYSAKSLLEKFIFIVPEDPSLVFSVRCTTRSSKDSRILLHAFSMVINEQCRTTVLQNAYAVELFREPDDGQLLPDESGLREGATACFAVGTPLFILASFFCIAFVVFFVLTLVTRIKSHRTDRS